MSKKILLIADDDEMNRRIIKRFLKDTYDVIEAGDGRRTIEILTNEHVDALLLDIIMPKLDGLEVLKEIRADKNYRSLAILVATSTKEKTERQALSLGADDIVSKPYDPIVIQKRLDNILQIKEVQRQRELLTTSDVDTLLREQRAKIGRQLGEMAERMHTYAQIIRENTENTKLLEEMASDIDQEAEKAKTLV